MPKCSSYARIGLENLGHHACKKQHLSKPSNKENDPPVSHHPSRPDLSPEIEEEVDVNHSPAINSLPFNPLGPTMVNADVIYRTDLNSEDNDSSDEEDGRDDDGSDEEAPVSKANSWESCQPPSLHDAQACLIDIN